MTTAKELRQKYLDFFVKKGHKILPNVSLVPEDVSSSALFISAGMHPLIPYLLGEPHPLGKRLVSNQRCLRTGDIEEVGDSLHLTFFEMLGNWGLGDPASPNASQDGPTSPDGGQGGYWKEEAISWSYEFMTKILDLPIKRLSVSCFAGDKDAPKDEESAAVWKKLGIPSNRIYFFDKKENWWGPVESTGPCGPDSEMFIDMGGECRLGRSDCNPSCQCGRYFEIWNDVFMQYNRRPDGKYEPLKQKNVDTGMGVERVLSVLQEKDDIFLIERFEPIIRFAEEIIGRKYEDENIRPMRIVVEHLRSASFVIADGVIPSNLEQGYVLRRLIRKATFQLRQMQTAYCLPEASKKIVQKVTNLYSGEYPNLKGSINIASILAEEVEKFEGTLGRGIKFLEEQKQFTGEVAFNALQSFGIPFDVTAQVAFQRNQKIDRQDFDKRFSEHQKISRAGVERKFAGGLADHSEIVTKLHTTTHLLHQALRDVLGDHVRQVGSNITPERLRFDFTHPDKLTEDQIKKVESIINEKIKADLPVEMEMMNLEEAKKRGAAALFAEKYGEQVKTYSVKGFSFEVCGGPHVSSTGQIGSVKIFKEKAVGVGRRRIYAKLE